jgi:nucleotide-binding universal stress UspA family protein
VPDVADPVWPAYGSAMDIPGMVEERKQRLNSFLADELQDIATTRVVLEGDPAWRIAEYTEDQKVDLIMTPTHGYGPFRRFLLGSVTAKLLHDVKCPVWTSAHAPHAPAPPAGYKDVTCAVDLGPSSLPLLRWASDFARENGATLRLAHAIPAARTSAIFDVEGDSFRAFLFDQARQELAKLQRDAGTNLDVILEPGDVPSVLAKIPTDLIIIGRGIMQHVLGSLRTNVYAVIREAPSPVISV